MRSGTIESLLNVSQAVVSEKELSSALKTVVECAAAAVCAEMTAVGLIDWEAKELQYVQSYGELADKVKGSRFPLTKSVRGLVSKTGEPIVINDAIADRRVPPEIISEWGIRSLLVVPMKIRKKVIGVLAAANRHGGPFATQDLRVFETIANHGAAAVAHAGLDARARAALFELEAEKMKIEAVLAQLGDGVVVCDNDNRIIVINAAAEKILEVCAADMIGKNLLDVHSDMYRMEIKSAMQQIAVHRANDGVFWEQNVVLPSHKIVRMHLRPVFLKNGAFIGTATVMQDITEQVELDEAKTEFVSTVAHELRTPLTALKGSLGLVVGGAVGEIEPSLRELLGIAQNSCDRLIRLVDNILDMAKIESGHLSLEHEIFLVQNRVMSAVKQMGQLADEHKVKFVAKVLGRPPQVVGDGDRIEQVVTNLLSNAIRFSPPGATIDVNVRQVHGYIRVGITDQGPGIPQSQHKKVFDKFYRLNNHTSTRDGGSGLGLAISKAIVEQHGGKIYVKSIEGKGSTFAFLLPVPGEEAYLSNERDG